MRRAALLTVILILTSSATALTETTSFPGGTLEVVWVDDTALSIHVVLDASPVQADGAALMWVLTVNALRPGDGIHSWQLHLSAAHSSVVVIPNDFLVVRRFTPEQLQIDTSASESGRVLSVLVPRSGPIPELIAPGDALAVHALWIQQSSLVAARVPEAVPSGAGGGTTGDGYVPVYSVYEKGTPIRHSFPLVDATTGEPIGWGAATIALVRVQENEADEIIRYLYREPDPATGIVSYEFDTLNLAPGTYDLVVWANPPGVTVRHRIELVPVS